MCNFVVLGIIANKTVLVSTFTICLKYFMLMFIDDNVLIFYGVSPIHIITSKYTNVKVLF